MGINKRSEEMKKHKCRKANLVAKCVYCGKRMVMVKGNWYAEDYLANLVNFDKLVDKLNVTEFRKFKEAFKE